jgi:3-hydroxyisobutyrate dehydrogenase-like beta-hydroxyacid dehydrogenase
MHYTTFPEQHKAPGGKMKLSTNPIIGFIGFGEVAYYLSRGLRKEGVEHILAYARSMAKPGYGEGIRHRAQEAGVELTPTLEELVTRSELVISAVYGHVALEVAEDAARFIHPGSLFADLNNAPPSAKKQGAEVIHAKGAKFVDIGLFETPARAEHKALMVVSGDGAELFKEVMSKYGMNIEVIPGEAGKATTIKTLANIYIKGIQALCLELALSAYQAGVDLDLLGPLVVRPVATLPREQDMAFWIVRGGLYATRKAAELQDMLETIEGWGIDPIMMKATIQRLNLIAQYELKDHFRAGLSLEDYQAMLEAMHKIAQERAIGLK